MIFTLEEIKIKIANGEEAFSLLNSYIAVHPDDDEAFTLRGMRYWAAGQRSAAINDYLAALRINPESRAKLCLKTANEILDFYNKDLLNP